MRAAFWPRCAQVPAPPRLSTRARASAGKDIPNPLLRYAAADSKQRRSEWKVSSAAEWVPAPEPQVLSTPLQRRPPGPTPALAQPRYSDIALYPVPGARCCRGVEFLRVACQLLR